MNAPKLMPALLLDMDGVLAEVSKSYRASIVATCHHYNAKSVTFETVGEWKARGGCNNDWVLSLDLINDSSDGDKGLNLEQVTKTFEECAIDSWCLPYLQIYLRICLGGPFQGHRTQGFHIHNLRV